MTAQISNLLRETKVNQFDMAIFVEENVLRFEITIDNVAFMKLLNCNKHLGEVED